MTVPPGSHGVFHKQLSSSSGQRQKLRIACVFAAICAAHMTANFGKFSWKKFACREIPTRTEGTAPRSLRSKPQPVKDLHFLNCGRKLARFESVRQSIHKWTFRESVPNPVCCRSLGNKHGFDSHHFIYLRASYPIGDPASSRGTELLKIHWLRFHHEAAF